MSMRCGRKRPVPISAIGSSADFLTAGSIPIKISTKRDRPIHMISIFACSTSWSRPPASSTVAATRDAATPIRVTSSLDTNSSPLKPVSTTARKSSPPSTLPIRTTGRPRKSTFPNNLRNASPDKCSMPHLVQEALRLLSKPVFKRNKCSDSRRCGYIFSSRYADDNSGADRKRGDKRFVVLEPLVSKHA